MCEFRLSRCAEWSRRRRAFASGHQRISEDVEIATTSFNILWGLLEYKRTIHGRAFRLLWLPLVSDRGGAPEQGEGDE